MQHPIIRNSVIDRVQLVDSPPAFAKSEGAPQSAAQEETLNTSERQVGSRSSGASENPE